MAHEYSVLIHNWLSDKIKTAAQGLNNSQVNTSCQKSFYKGQLEELNDIRKHLTDQIDLDTHQYYKK